MRLLRLRGFADWFRGGGFFAMLLALVVVLASCSSSLNVIGGPGVATQPRGKTVPPVAIQQITGMPLGKAAELKAAVARTAGERDIGVVEGEFQNGSFTWSGSFRAVSDASGVKVTYQWQLRDVEGVLIHTYDGVENAGLFNGQDPWQAVTPEVMDRIGRASGEAIAIKLSQMGYATRVSALWVPPAEYFAMAGPGAEREVDMETLNGPEPSSELALAMDGLGPEADMTDGKPAATEPPTEVAAAEAPAAAATPEAPQAAEAEAPGKPEISAVAVLQVKGSPGSGNAELTSAMRRTLAAAGWPVVSKPQPNAITIIGSVNVAKATGDQQDVSVRWIVKTPAGSKLGDVKQANRVPAGTLDAGWGPAAFAVAEGAAAGIFDIVKRYQ